MHALGDDDDGGSDDGGSDDGGSDDDGSDDDGGDDDGADGHRTATTSTRTSITLKCDSSLLSRQTGTPPRNMTKDPPPENRLEKMPP